uniref:RNA-binding Raly-like protein n=1 Tax=Latimeria chalumnae TaxID=7897 RepID=H3AF03_LATCH
MDYDYYKDQLCNRMYDYPRVLPPTQAVVPVKRPQTTASIHRKGRPSIIARGRSPPDSQSPKRTKLRAEDIHIIKTELTQIKAQVDGLLDSLEKMDQQTRKQRVAESKGSEDGAACTETDTAESSEGSVKEAPNMGRAERGGTRNHDGLEVKEEEEELAAEEMPLQFK